MKTIRIDLPSRNYPVYLGRGLLPRSELWKKHLGDGKILIVSNETVAPLYLDTLIEALAGKNADVHVIPDGERFKTFETWRGILDRLVAHGCVVTVLPATASLEQVLSHDPEGVFLSNGQRQRILIAS